MERQTALLRVAPEARDDQIRTVRIAPGFPAFIEFCRRPGGELKIALNRLDRLASAVLRRARFSEPSFTNKLRWQEGHRWRLAFLYAQANAASVALIAHAHTANGRCCSYTR